MLSDFEFRFFDKMAYWHHPGKINFFQNSYFFLYQNTSFSRPSLEQIICLVNKHDENEVNLRDEIYGKNIALILSIRYVYKGVQKFPKSPRIQSLPLQNQKALF